MGYRSQVRALIYGDPDVVCALVAAHVLQGGVNVLEAFKDDITRYRLTRRVYDREATLAQETKDGTRRGVWKEVETEVIDLYGDDWKWYPNYPDVAAWSAFMIAAGELGLNTEFVRLGEETDDTECDTCVQDDGDYYLHVRRSIAADIPDDTRPVDYEKEVQNA